MRIIRIVKDSIIRRCDYYLEIKKEFDEWDKLSDEVFINFESKL